MERIPVVFGDPPKGRHPMVHDLATIMKAIAVVVEILLKEDHQMRHDLTSSYTMEKD